MPHSPTPRSTSAGLVAAAPAVDSSDGRRGTTEVDRRSAEEAFRTHVLPQIPVLFGIARRLTTSPQDAEDLVQDTLVKAFRAIGTFDGRYARSWLLTILRNTNTNRLRKRMPDLLEDEWTTLGRMPAAGADGRDGPAELVAEGLSGEAVVAALEALPMHHRAVVALVDIDGLSYREAADVLGVPVGTVMSRLHRARAKLRRHVRSPSSLLEERE
ncbi:RNA polymerase sigma factor [Euzebya pacifica]|uniref:RNA polymerase sigma factor n=1 Tax=Euzebya pacifica TaxID=1608957 RepID=UPI000DF7B4A0|nr:sigma-70 family RNA polymerase sigma factor [Euzebya pacifica]